MKLFIEHKVDQSGKGKFLNRAIPYWEGMGIKCQFINSQSADVALCLSKVRTEPKIPIILRVDGIHIVSGKKSYWNNGRVRNGIKKADAVIWQSKWCRFMTRSILDIPQKHEYVIWNGAQPNDYKLQKMDMGYTYNVLLSAKWGKRKHKRLTQMIDIAIEYTRTRRDVMFWIAGGLNGFPKKCDNITYLGTLPDEELRKYLVSCDVMLNLAYYDWCPNAVIEALTAGLPVIYSEGTGVQEIVGDSGTMVSDKCVKNKYTPKENPPKLDHKEVFAALNKELTNKRRVSRPELYIENIAIKYKEVFENVLSQTA